MVGLGDLPGSRFVSGATGISGDGSVIVGHGDTEQPGGQRAFRWTADGGIVSLGSLRGHEPDSSAATAVSHDGSVVVGRGSPSLFSIEAFRWTAAGGMIGLGFLPTDGYSYATGVSADGSAVVGSSSHLSDNGEGGITVIWQAFRWTARDGLVGLGTMSGHESSEARGVSADGSVVVGGGGPAFIWDEAHGMRSLSDVLRDLGADLSGWELHNATGISANGLTVVGTGTDPSGEPIGWIATIPEPVNLLLLTLPCLLLARRRRRAGLSPVSVTRPRQASDNDKERTPVRIHRIVAVQFALALLAVPSRTRAAEATLRPLDFYPSAISADATTVVGESAGAVRWTADGGTVRLGDGSATALSADGSVVVGGRPAMIGNSLTSEAFRWTANTGMVALPPLPNGVRASTPPASRATARSSWDRRRWPTAGECLEPGSLLWTADGRVSSLDFFARAISTDGAAVVGNRHCDSLSVRWTATGGIVGLGSMVGFDSSLAAAVSRDGSVAVGNVHRECENLSNCNFARRRRFAGPPTRGTSRSACSPAPGPAAGTRSPATAPSSLGPAATLVAPTARRSFGMRRLACGVFERNWQTSGWTRRVGG